ncbi:acyl-CoA dehydrogenase [Auritidibacter sp. NML100628]|nr:acyl-CoA dehydrogenase [Auritidibacter sp. NML100628]
MSMTSTVACDPELRLPFPDADLFDVASLLTADERQALRAVRSYMQDVVRPVIVDYWNREEFPFELLSGMAEVGLADVALQDRSWLYRGLVYSEVSRVDVSLGALVGIHNELIVGMVNQLGSEAQRQQWLPKLTRFEAVGSFGMTEPDHGSDIAGGLETTATPVEGGWVINGAKRWIGAGTFCDFLLAWAKDAADGSVKAFLIDSSTPGFSAAKIGHKIGLRVMQNADITLDNVLVSSDDMLPGVVGFDSANEMLRNSRVWVGWQAVGAQLGAFDVMRNYALNRQQFGRRLVKFQLIQQGLADLISNAHACLGIMMNIARLQETNQIEMVHAAMGKATGSRLLRESAAIARNALGGNGILSTYEAAKIFGDAEVIHTYEGTYEINSLIVSRAVTGHSAFV